MRRLFLIAALVSGFTLSACSTTQIANINDTIAKVQDATRLGCSFLPTIKTVADILASLVSGAAPVEQLVASVAAQICTAVAPVKSAALRGVARAPGPPPMVNGVVIHGRFVSK